MATITIADNRHFKDEEIAVDAENVLEAVERVAGDGDHVVISATVRDGMAVIGDGYDDSDVYLAIDHAAVLTDVETIREAAEEALRPSLTDRYREEIGSQRPRNVGTERATYDERDERTLAIEPSIAGSHWNSWEIAAIGESSQWEIVGVETGEHGVRLVLERSTMSIEEAQAHLDPQFTCHVVTSENPNRDLYVARDGEDEGDIDLPAGWSVSRSEVTGGFEFVREQ